MKSLIRLVVFCAIALAITACGSVYKTTYHYQPPTDAKGQVCTVQCQQSKKLCQRLCNSSHGTCQKQANEQAQRSYAEYVAERQTNKQPIKKKQRDFVDTSACVQDECECEDEYRSCFQLCGGKAIPQKTCVASCGR